ncbi:beta-glucanase [Actinomyces sp. Chiba101]|uniref:glycoside hydrolase family 16 protein n=2 Tax=Actinomycetaceae TaxID=2049 RepID=UPI000974DDF8|nr:MULTISPECIES: family 16 glycosylhydrolase [Actinomyces]BAW93832.1 beta-glucanase [Actinomyces sp. Chiba101]GAV93915.1 beta-glucanase [Actinomyces denticolens]SUU74338.1 Kappa-carrageenase precursor [Actinomyces denticolens]
MISRRHALMSLAVLAGLPAATVLATSPARAEGARIDPTGPGWVMAPSLSDEFTTLDESRWRKGLWYPVSADAGRFSPDNALVSDGVLRLEARREPSQVGGKTIPMTFGAVESRFDTPGLNSYIEVRARCLDTANILSAIWLQSSTLTGEDRLIADPNPEIDVQESTTDPDVNWAHHLWPWTGSGHTRRDARPSGGKHSAGVDLTADFHLYGVERSGAHVRLYLDRVLYADIDTGALEADFGSLARMSRHVVLSLEGHSRSPHRPELLPRSFDIDYVRTYVNDADVVRADGKRRLVAPDGRLLANRGGRLVLVPASETAEGTWWALTQHDDLTYEITADGAHLAQERPDGWYARNLPVVARPEAGAGADDASSLARWHVRGTGDCAQLLNKVSGLPLVLDEAGQGVVVRGKDGATCWRLEAPAMPEPSPSPSQGPGAPSPSASASPMPSVAPPPSAGATGPAAPSPSPAPTAPPSGGAGNGPLASTGSPAAVTAAAAVAIAATGGALMRRRGA